MLLRVPPENVAHMIARERVRAEPVAIWTRVRTENAMPVGAVVETVCVVERVAGFVAEKAHHVHLGLHLDRELLLDARQPLIREVKRNANDRGPVWASPLVAQVYGWVKMKAFRIQLSVQPIDVLLDERSAYRE